MRIPITEVHVGMVIIEANESRHEVVDRGSWCPASGGPPWIQLGLRAMASGGLTLTGYSPDADVEVDPAIVPGRAEPSSARDRGSM
jgi:hypothetical protein